jgi:hypothetical protein
MDALSSTTGPKGVREAIGREATTNMNKAALIKKFNIPQ